MVTTQRPHGTRASRGGGVGYRPGIDGLRALAVTAVLLYHADVTWLRGGFLGVDVFFVISGYLICSLLLAEWARTGTISLKDFWLRRARRLLPAVVATVVGVAFVAVVLAPDAVSRLRGDIPAALAYISNWWQVFGGQSYFEAMGRPPLLRHLWSLAVEEQFYITFPILLVAGLRRFGRRPGVLAAAALITGVASAVLMAVLWSPHGDPTRVWYGTDTRAVGLCAGVALAFIYPMAAMRRGVSLGVRRRMDAAGLIALVALGLLMVRLDEFQSELYRGGFAATAVVSSMLVVSAAHPATYFGRILGMRPLRWIGMRSYAIYLWHWPVFMLTRPGLDVELSGGSLMAIRFGLTVLLAALSWRLVEQPFLDGSVQQAWRSGMRVRRAAALAAAAVAMLLVAGVAVARPPATTSLASGVEEGAVLAPVEVLESIAHVVDSAPDHRVIVASPDPPPSPAPKAPPPKPAPRPAPKAQPRPAPRRPAPPPPPAAPLKLPAGHVIAIGDSVMLGARSALVQTLKHNVTVDAVVARHVDAGLNVLQSYRDRGLLKQVSAVVVHFGTNGPFYPHQFQRLRQLTQAVPRVVVINVHVPRSWESISNRTISSGVSQVPRMRMADWHTAAGRPGMVGADGVHCTAKGAWLYAQLVLWKLQ